MTLNEFLLTKRKELYNELVAKHDWTTMSAQEQLFVNNQIEEEIQSKRSEWMNEFPPDIYFQISKGGKYSTDDEMFTDKIAATKCCLEESELHPDTPYVLWAFEGKFLPYPVSIFFDGKEFIGPMLPQTKVGVAMKNVTTTGGISISGVRVG